MCQNQLGNDELARYRAWGIPIELGEIPQRPGTLSLSGRAHAHAWELHTLSIHMSTITVYMSCVSGTWLAGMPVSEQLRDQLRAICESYTGAHPEAFLAAARARRSARVAQLRGARTPSEHDELTRARLAEAAVEMPTEQERLLAEQLVAAGACTEAHSLIELVAATLSEGRKVRA